MRLNDDRGALVGGLVVTERDQVIAIKASGQITRSAVAEVPVKGRDTMGVKFVGVSGNDSVVVIALNPETTAEAAVIDTATVDGTEVPVDGSVAPATEPGVLEDDGPTAASAENTALEGDRSSRHGEEE